MYLAAAEGLRKNSGQWAAYESKRHCVVLAGPGSGKTKTLTIKLARMLAEDICAPRGVACITYSNQCVRELQRRLSRLGLDWTTRLFVGTVHSFCLSEIVLPFSHLAGITLPAPAVVATRSEQIKIFQRAVRNILGSYENPDFVFVPFQEFRRTVLDRESKEWLSDDRYPALIQEYERLLQDEGKIDFDGMVLTGLKLVEGADWVRKAIKAKYPILVVDEYQDLGVPLHRLVVALCFQAGVRLLAVGDPDQSIYGFTGARPNLLEELARSPHVEPVRLKLNYRSGSRIIQASSGVLLEDRDFEAANEQEGLVYGHGCPKGYQEQVDKVCREIVPQALARRKGRTLGDIGVLYLDQYDGQVVAEAATSASFSIVRFDQGNPYPRTPLTAWLEDCAAWCSGGWQHGEPRLSSLIGAWLAFHPSLRVEDRIVECRRRLANFLFGSRRPDMFLSEWLALQEESSLYEFLEGEGTMADEIDALKSVRAASNNEKVLGAWTVALFGGQRGSPDHLNLTTIHSAKGLEYDVVIMVGLEEGRIPRWRATDAQKRESRRLFYVAMTRARHEVHLLYSGWYVNRNGQRFQNGPSSFLFDLQKRLKEEQSA